MSAGPEHQHTKERRSTWDGLSVYWRLSHRPENGGELILFKGTVSQVLNTDFFLSDDVLTLVPIPTNGVEYTVYYSYCDLDAGNLPGETYWIEGDGDDTTIGGWAPGETLIAEENGFSTVGFAGSAGGFTLPMASGAAAGTAGSISITSGAGVRRSYSYFVATLYLQKTSDFTLWKLVNAVRDSSSGLFVTSPVLMATPVLIGATYVKVAPSDTQVAYAFDTAAKANTNIYKTINGGSTWTTLEVIAADVTAGRRIAAGCVHPTNPDVVWVALNLASGAGGGIYKTINGGATWTRVLSKSITFFAATNVIDVDPVNPNNVIYADRNAGELNSTIDGGTTWTTVSTMSNVRLVSFLTSPADTAIAMGGGGQGRTAYKSTDGGVTWASLDTITWDPLLLVSNNESYTVIGQRTPSNAEVGYQGGLFDPVSAGMKDAMYSASAPRLFVGIYDNITHQIYRSFDGVTWTLFWDDGSTGWNTIGCV